jgi:phosphoribosylaminoimidazole-succinocarboxamide synthase
MPPGIRAHAGMLRGRAMLVRRARRLDVECVVRGYLAGSGWHDYRREGAICGVPLPAGLREGEALRAPIFTPATKASSGHDRNIGFDEMVPLVGAGLAARLRDVSLALYRDAHAHAASRGLVLADTKFEFGLVAGPAGEELILIDEALTPDSSRSTSSSCATTWSRSRGTGSLRRRRCRSRSWTRRGHGISRHIAASPGGRSTEWPRSA